MSNLIEDNNSVTVQTLDLNGILLPFSIVVNKTPEWKRIGAVALSELLEIYTINFLTEIDTKNRHDGKINIFHSHEYFLIFQNPANLNKMLVQCDPRDIPSCEYITQLHTPETLKERNIFLHCNDNYWAKYAYQFFHEFCHYMTKTITKNWFLEALCELASLFFLRKLSKTWLTISLTEHPACKNYHTSFFNYAQEIIDSVQIPDSMVKWYDTHKDELQINSTNRDLNKVVAKYFLPYFDENPGIWNIVCFTPFEDITDFPIFMSKWIENCPVIYKRHIQKFISDLGL